MTAAFAEMQRLHDMLSRYRIGNPVHALHLAAGLQAVPIAPEMMGVLQMAVQRSQQTQGAFDITVGAFTGWDFSDSGSKVPSADEIARELPLVDYRQLVLNEKLSTAYLRRRGMRIDLGGIAKLPILQAGMRVLKAHGIHNAMLNGGGDVVERARKQCHAVWAAGGLPVVWVQNVVEALSITHEEALVVARCGNKAVAQVQGAKNAFGGTRIAQTHPPIAAL